MTTRHISGTSDTFAAEPAVPGDKSLSHRALLFAGLAEGDSFVSGVGPGLDVASTATALHALGVQFTAVSDGIQIRSPGVEGWHTPDAPIDCGNSGTTMRLLAGALSTSSTRATLIGDESLSKRPMTRLEGPLSALGGKLETTDGRAPLEVGGADSVRGTDIVVEHASAQVRSAFQLAALAAPGPSTIDSPPGFRDHTERWLSAIGRGAWESGTRYRIDPGPLPPARYDVPADPSSAAFLWTAAAISPGSEVLTRNVSLNPGRIGFLEILEAMGATVDAVVTADVGGDPVGDVKITGRELHGVDIDGSVVPAALDELPLVAVLGAYGEGVTRVRDAAELRVKETDRIAAVEDMLVALEGGIATYEDGFDVIGTGFLTGGTVETHHDHRIAMAAAVAATRATGTVDIIDSDVAAVSWPTFYEVLEGLWS